MNSHVITFNSGIFFLKDMIFYQTFLEMLLERGFADAQSTLNSSNCLWNHLKKYKFFTTIVPTSYQTLNTESLLSIQPLVTPLVFSFEFCTDFAKFWAIRIETFFIACLWFLILKRGMWILSLGFRRHSASIRTRYSNSLLLKTFNNFDLTFTWIYGFIDRVKRMIINQIVIYIFFIYFFIIDFL